MISRQYSSVTCNVKPYFQLRIGQKWWFVRFVCPAKDPRSFNFQIWDMHETRNGHHQLMPMFNETKIPESGWMENSERKKTFNNSIFASEIQKDHETWGGWSYWKSQAPKISLVLFRKKITSFLQIYSLWLETCAIQYIKDFCSFCYYGIDLLRLYFHVIFALQRDMPSLFWTCPKRWVNKETK